MPEPTNAAREWAVTALTPETAHLWIEAMVRLVGDQGGPLGDLLDAVRRTERFGIGRVLNDAADAVEAALRGEQP